MPVLFAVELNRLDMNSWLQSVSYTGDYYHLSKNQILDQIVSQYHQEGGVCRRNPRHSSQSDCYSIDRGIRTEVSMYAVLICRRETFPVPREQVRRL